MARTIEERRKYQRKYYAAHPEKVRECSRKWKAANPEKHHEHNRKYYATNLEKIKDRRRLRMYGLEPGEYKARLLSQGGGCLICGDPPGKRRLHVDHDHGTGAVRGLLCGNCNRGLGNFKDDPALFRNAIAYLERR